MIQLGRKYRDAITGFEGVAVGLVKYISGCNQVLLAPKVDAEGKLRESQWFDEQRMTEQDGAPIELDNSRASGFDKQAPKR